MPWALAAAAVTVGGNLLTSNNASKAAEKQGDLAYKASQDTIAENRREFDTVRADNQPFRDVGVSAVGAIGSAFGLPGYAPSMTGPRVASTPVPGVGGISMTGGAKTPGGMVSDPASVSPAMTGGGLVNGQPAEVWDAYLADPANADVLAWAQSGHGDPNIPIEQQSLEQRAAYQYRNSGQGEGRPLPQVSMTGDPSDPAYQPGYNDPTVPNGYGVGARPDPGSAPVRMTGPGLDVSLGAYQKSPDYDFRQSEGLKGLDHVASSIGGVMSGARIKAAERFNQDLATQDYTDWRNYTTGQFNTDRSRSDAIYGQDLSQYDANRARSDGLYADDRAFGAGRYDTRNSQLLTLAGFGSGANAQNQSAAQSFAQSDAQARMTGAVAQGNAAVQGANAWTSGFNNLVTTGAYLGGRYMSNPQSYIGVRPAGAFDGMASDIEGLY